MGDHGLYSDSRDEGRLCHLRARRQVCFVIFSLLAGRGRDGARRSLSGGRATA
jgi:hypothetical protein